MLEILFIYSLLIQTLSNCLVRISAILFQVSTCSSFCSNTLCFFQSKYVFFNNQSQNIFNQAFSESLNISRKAIWVSSHQLQSTFRSYFHSILAIL
ncbi:hypothetical protein HOG27_00725 [bacterium]|nr:hypothetical protein [bacterium]